jgi:hypothetical protein
MATSKLANIVNLKNENCYTNNASSSRVGMEICLHPIFYPKYKELSKCSNVPKNLICSTSNCINNMGK